MRQDGGPGQHDEDAHMQRAGLLADMGRAGESLAACDRAIGPDGGHAEAHAGRAEFLATLGRVDDALYSYNRTIGPGPRRAGALAAGGGRPGALWQGRRGCRALQGGTRTDAGRGQAGGGARAALPPERMKTPPKGGDDAAPLGNLVEPRMEPALVLGIGHLVELFPRHAVEPGRLLPVFGHQLCPRLGGPPFEVL